MNTDNLLARIFTYTFQLIVTIIALWLSYKIKTPINFMIYGIIALILSVSMLISSIALSIKNTINYNYIDLAFSLTILGLNVWCVFSCFKLWL